MSKLSYQHNDHKNFTSVLPDIVANYKTVMCNPYSKPQSLSNRPSKIPVSLSRTSVTTVKIQRPVNKPGTKPARPSASTISTAKKACAPVKLAGLPAGMFGTKSGLEKFKIPKVKRDNCNASSNASNTHNLISKSRKLASHQSRIPSVSRANISKHVTATNGNTTKISQKPSRIPVIQASKPKLSQPKRDNITTKPKCSVVKTNAESRTTFSSAATKVLKPSDRKPQQQNQQGPWPYDIPPCSRYEIKWGDPAYTGSYVDGEWWYDTVGAAPKPMKWPDTIDMFPDLPTGIFELRPVASCVVPSEQSAALEGKPESCSEHQEQPNPSEAGTFQSGKPTSCHADLHNTLSAATKSSVNTCFYNQSEKMSLPRYTTVEAVTQTTTLCDQVRVTPCHSVDRTKNIKRDSRGETGVKPSRDTVRCDNQPLNRNLHKSLTIISSTNQFLKRGVKRSADDFSETLLSKKIRLTERQD